MKEKLIYRGKITIKILSTFIVTLSIIMILAFPKEIIDSSKEALYLWANIVLPSLFPFFVGAEILVGLGVVKFIAVLLEPLTLKIFKAPGEASFIFIMSLTSGYPIGVKLASQLESSGELGTKEAQRIMSFCSTSGPLFIIGAVAIGMFNSTIIGYIIAASHYIAAVLVGITLAYFTKDYTYSPKPRNSNILKESLQAMLNARKNDGRPFGKLLSDAVMSSLNTLLLICGILVVFSVIIKEIQLLKVPELILHVLNKPSSGHAKDLVDIMLYGMTEITLGCKSAANALNLGLNTRVILAAMIISWSGFSIHAQVAGVLGKTRLSLSRYILTKLLHCFYTGILAFAILAKIKIRPAVSVFLENTDHTGLLSLTRVNLLLFSTKIFALICIMLILCGLSYRYVRGD